MPDEPTTSAASIDDRWRALQDEADKVAAEVEQQMPGGKWHAENLRTFMLRADALFREARHAE